MALAAALLLERLATPWEDCHIAFCAGGTDGQDGPTPAAGAVVDQRCAGLARMEGLVPEVFLENNDSFGFFEAYDAQVAPKHAPTQPCLLRPGPTGTNVMDVYFVLVQWGSQAEPVGCQK